MGFDPDELPVVLAFRGKAMNGLSRLVLEADSVPTDWIPSKQLREQIDLSNTGFQNSREKAVSFGFIEPSDPDANMTRYKIPDSPPVELLRSFHTEYDPSEDDDVADDITEIVLPDLMELNGRARLIAWFLAAADPDEQYSISKMADAAPVGHTTVRNYITTLADYGIVTTDEVSRGSMTYTVYQFNPESVVAAVLYDINETVAKQRRQFNE
jgi:hypothetical protein